jgi:hypothetical protein
MNIGVCCGREYGDIRLFIFWIFSCIILYINDRFLLFAVGGFTNLQGSFASKVASSYLITNGSFGAKAALHSQASNYRYVPQAAN